MCICVFEERNGEESEHYEVVYEGLAEQTKIKGLSPSTRYRVRVVACNSEGESQPSAAIGMNTSSMHPPKQPQRPQLASLSSRAVKLSWSDLPEHSYTVCSNSFNGLFLFIGSGLCKGYPEVKNPLSTFETAFCVFEAT